MLPLFFADIHHSKAWGPVAADSWEAAWHRLSGLCYQSSNNGCDSVRWTESSLLQMCLFHLQRFSHLLKLIFLVLTKTGIIFNAHLFAELFFLFVFLSVPGLILGVWYLVPWPGIEPGPPEMWVQSPTHWTNPPPKINILSWSYHAGRTLWLRRSPRFSSTLVHFQESLGSAFILEIYWVVYNVETKIRHISYLKFLSVDRGAGKKKKNPMPCLYSH